MPHRLHAELLKPRLNWLPLWWWAGYAAAGQWGHKRNKWIGHHSYIARGKTGGKGNEVKEWILNKSPMHRLMAFHYRYGRGEYDGREWQGEITHSNGFVCSLYKLQVKGSAIMDRASYSC